MKKHLLVAAALVAVFSAVPAIAGVNVFITPPPIPVPVPGVLLPPPPGVVIGPSYWYWDSARGSWFFYDRFRHPHYVLRHGFVNDGRHFYAAGGRWSPARHDMARHMDRNPGKRGRGRKHDRGHDRGEN